MKKILAILLFGLLAFNIVSAELEIDKATYCSSFTPELTGEDCDNSYYEASKEITETPPEQTGNTAEEVPEVTDSTPIPPEGAQNDSSNNIVVETSATGTVERVPKSKSEYCGPDGISLGGIECDAAYEKYLVGISELPPIEINIPPTTEGSFGNEPAANSIIGGGSSGILIILVIVILILLFVIFKKKKDSI